MLSDFLQNYLPIIIFLVLALGLSCAFVVINFILSPKRPDPEKLSAYECGFEPFEDSRMEFDVRFYLVAILFIIFDLETAYLFPWALALRSVGWPGFAAMLVFLGVLLIAVAVAVFSYYTAWTILLPLGLFERSPALSPYLSSIFLPKEYAAIIPATILVAAVLVLAAFISYINFKQALKKKRS